MRRFPLVLSRLRSIPSTCFVALAVVWSSACTPDTFIYTLGLVEVLTEDDWCGTSDHNYDGSYYGNPYVSPHGGQDFEEMRSFDFASSERTLAGDSDTDGFEFFLEENAWVLVSVESLDGVNPFVQLYDTWGELVAEDDNSGTDADALLAVQVTRGRYVAVVSSRDDGQRKGSYVIGILVGSDAGMDLETIGLGNSVEIENEVLSADQPERTMIFTLEESGTLQIELARSDEMGADLELTLLDQAGNEVLVQEVPSASDLALEYELASEGSYMLIMRNMENDGEARYDLRLALEEQGFQNTPLFLAPAIAPEQTGTN